MTDLIKTFIAPSSSDISKENEKLTCNVVNCSICNLENNISSEWMRVLEDETKKNYFAEIKKYLHGCPTFYPPLNKIFNFTFLTSFQEIKVVIIGQDPYHNVGQAMGLSFSVPNGVRIPPSLKNIFAELKEDIPDFKIPSHGNLTKWAEQGVLLLNDVLTVLPNQPSSHAKIGWKIFTTRILELINENHKNVVFILWGSHAKQKAKFIDRSKHLVLESAHPSPFSFHLFRGCRHFSKANSYLKSNNKEEINWSDL